MPKDTEVVQKPSTNLFSLRSTLQKAALHLCGSLFHSPPKSKSRIKINLHIWDVPFDIMSG